LTRDGKALKALLLRDMQNRNIENQIKKELDEVDFERKQIKRSEISTINKQLKLDDLKGLKE
jgi:hypothetical protein